MRDWIKKALALALCLAMVLSLAACGGADTPAETTDTPSPSEETPAEGGILENDEDIYMAAMGEFTTPIWLPLRPRRSVSAGR